MKTVLLKKSEYEISAVEPTFYRQRFLDFLDKYLLSMNDPSANELEMIRERRSKSNYSQRMKKAKSIIRPFWINHLSWLMLILTPQISNQFFYLWVAIIIKNINSHVWKVDNFSAEFLLWKSQEERFGWGESIVGVGLKLESAVVLVVEIKWLRIWIVQNVSGK